MIEINNTTYQKINLALVKGVTEKFLKYYKIEGKEISVAFVGDKRIRTINSQYRKQDKITDVLSFNGEGDFLGEVVIDYQQIKRQAKKQKKSVKSELIFILVHGLLHLKGYDDDTEHKRLKMIELGEEFLRSYKVKS